MDLWKEKFSIDWRHNDHDGVSNHQPHDCLLNRLFRRRSKKTSKLRVTGLCAGNSPGPVNSPHKGPVTRKMFPFDDVIMWHVTKTTSHRAIMKMKFTSLALKYYISFPMMTPFNSLRPGVISMHQSSGLSFIHGFPECFAPSHYLNQCWFLSVKLIGNNVSGIFNFNTFFLSRKYVWKCLQELCQ